MNIVKIISVVLASVMLVSCGTAVKDYEEDATMKETVNEHNSTVLNYPLFDGEKVITNASVTIKNGVITAVNEAESVDADCFLMSGLIDAHTHITTDAQIQTMLKNGVVAACDVAASDWLIERSESFSIISSAGMTMGTLNGKSYVKKAIESGARYIKVLLMEPNLMLKSVLSDICNFDGEYDLREIAENRIKTEFVK